MNRTESERDRQPTDPTPDQIRRRAEAIRRRWSPNVLDRRRVAESPTWRPPLVMTIELVREINSRNE